MSIPVFFQSRPLVSLQLFGWAIYIAADYFDHVFVGNFDFLPTLICGVAAYLMTGLAAILFDRMQASPAVLRWGVFSVVLYGSVVIWHKILLIFHHEGDSSVEAEFTRVLNASVGDWIATGFMPIFMFLSWAAFYFLARQYLARMAEQGMLQEAKLAARKAQLQTLRHQLNPHFLFNILNSIDVSIRSNDNETAHRMTQHLSRFLRSSLEQGEQDKIQLAQELAMIREFVAIEQIRFQDQLTVSLNVTEEAGQAVIPAMLLQPLVENALKFAWSQQGGGRAELQAERSSDRLVIRLTNSKAGASGRGGTGTGLRNTRERLELLYGGDAAIEVAEEETFFTVMLFLPWEVRV